MITIHRLQWCSKQCIIDRTRGILQVLPVPNPGLKQRRSRMADSVGHELVGRRLSPTEVEVRWEDSERAIWRVCGWFAVGEEIWLERVKGINQQHAVIILAKFFAPELIKRLLRQKERMRSFVTVHQLLTFVSFVNAFIIGSVYRNIGTP
jgi:hypothetical protein